MRVAFRNYGGKGDMLARALVDAGHELVPEANPTADVAVLDFDYPHLCALHERVVLYPHGGNPLLCWDGYSPPQPSVVMQLTHSESHAEVMRAYGYPTRLEPVGWCYSEVAPLRRPRGHRILFAPSHSTGAGRLAEEDADRNRRVKRALGDDPNVTVRVCYSLTAHGLEHHWSNILAVEGGSLRHDDIDQADMVIADGTVLHLAMARGAPTIALGSRVPPDLANGGPDEEAFRPTQWLSYSLMLRHPFDFDDAPLDDLLKRASTPFPHEAAWLTKWTPPFDAARAVRLVEEAAG